MNTPNLSDLVRHPLMKQVLAETAAREDAEAQARLEAESERVRLVHQRASMLEREMQGLLDEYDTARRALHGVAHRIFQCNQSFSREARCNMLTYPEQALLRLDLPSLRPATSPWGPLDNGFSTTKAAAMAFFATNGTDWPLPA